MPELKQKQLLFENCTWKRLLNYMMDENVHLKNRLSEILSNHVEKNLLDKLETFQNRFLKEDQRISLLRNEISEIDYLLLKDHFENAMVKKEISKKVNNLRRDIRHSERVFSLLRFSFNKFLTKNLTN